MVAERFIRRHLSRLSWRFSQCSDFQSWADFVLVVKVSVQRLRLRISCSVCGRFDHFRLASYLFKTGRENCGNISASL